MFMNYLLNAQSYYLALYPLTPLAPLLYFCTPGVVNLT